MKKAVFFLAIIIGVFGFWQKSQATVTYTDNFDSYATGSVNGQGGWVNYFGAASAQVDNTIASSSPNSLLFNDGQGTKVSFATSNNAHFSFNLYTTGPGQNLYLFFKNDSYTDLPYIYVSAATGTWVKEDIVIFYVSTGAETGYIQIDYFQNGTFQGESTSSAFNLNSLGFWAPNGQGGARIDNFSLIAHTNIIPEPPFSFFFDTTNFATQWPIGCQYTKVDSTASNISFLSIGQFTNAADSNVTYNTLKLLYFDALGNEGSSTLYTGTIVPGSAISWHKLITLPLGNYAIKYRAEGTNNSTGQNAPFTMGGSNNLTGETCISTAVGYFDISDFTPENNPLNYGNIGYLACQNFTSNCLGTSTSWTDNILCNIESFFVGMICPSQEAYEKTLEIISSAKDRFPFSYINAAKTSFTTFSSSSIATTSATTTYVQQDLSFFSKLKQITVLGYIRTMIGYVIIAIGGIYIVKTGANKILK